MDLIERQAAVSEIMDDLKDRSLHDDDSIPEDYAEGYDEGIRNAAVIVQQLPSAQPEIIHCKDCKNSEHWYRDRRRCFLWSEDGVSVFDDGFCSYAGRRTDE